MPRRPRCDRAPGGKTLASIKVEVFDETTGNVSGAARELKCDALAVAAGWSPLIHLASQAGGPPKYDEAIHAFLPGDAREAWIAAGAVCGTFAAEMAAADGARAGADAAKACGFSTSQETPSLRRKIRASLRRRGSSPSSRFPPRERPSSISRTT